MEPLIEEDLKIILLDHTQILNVFEMPKLCFTNQPTCSKTWKEIALIIYRFVIVNQIILYFYKYTKTICPLQTMKVYNQS